MTRRLRLKMILVALVVVVLGVALALYLRHLDFLNHFACFDGGGSWVDGRCRLPS